MSMIIGGSTGLVFPDASTQNTAATGFGFKNRIINGAMVIDQRNAGASVTAADNIYTLDRWQSGSSQSSKFSVQQVASAMSGFSASLKVTSLSAYSVGTSETFNVAQQIEGYNVADLAWGTADAAAVTLSFKVYSSLTGTFGGALANSNVTRSYPFSYTISAANTWTTVSVTIPGDTSGTWQTTTSTGIRCWFSLGTGATLSGTAGSWASADYRSATGATSVVGTNGATFYITGVQLEKGSTATSFDYRPYGTELVLCQRYYQVLYIGFEGLGGAGSSAGIGVTFSPSFRATPTLSNISNDRTINVSGGGPSTVNLRPYGSTFYKVAIADGSTGWGNTISAAAEL